MMPSPDPSILIRLLAGEAVFDRDTDSRILEAANEVTARALFEAFRRCDTSSPHWGEAFAELLKEISPGCPSILIGFDDGRWQGLESAGEEATEDSPGASPTPPDPRVEYFLRLQFSNADACYYQYHLVPSFNEPFIHAASRKRAGDSQYLRLTISRPEDLQVFIQNLRGNPHLEKVHDSSPEEFDQAPSHGV